MPKMTVRNGNGLCAVAGKELAEIFSGLDAPITVCAPEKRGLVPVRLSAGLGKRVER